MNLNNLQIQESGVVTSVNGNDEITRRLIEFGFIKGTTVKKIMVVPFRDPTFYELRGTQIALRKTEAERIEIENT